MITKLSKILGIIKDNSLLTGDDKDFISHNLIQWRNYKVSNPKNIILTDFYPLKESYIVLSYFLNILAKSSQAEIVVFGVKNNLWKRAFVQLYRSMNASRFLNIELKNNKADASAKSLFSSIKSKDDLINLRYKGLNIGLDVYESYLRVLSKPTVDVKDVRLLRFLEKATRQVEFLLDYFRKYNVSACVLSHDCYIPNNIVAKIAYLNNIPVYLPNNRGISVSGEQFSIHSYFKSFRKLFSNMNKKSQDRALAFARERLEKRFSGEVGVDMPYSTKTAFHQEKAAGRIIEKGSRPKVLILAHDFFDNPHAYSKLMFADFYEWLKFLKLISREVDYDWYIKSHPDASCETLDVIQELFGNNEQIKIVPSSTSHFQLVDEGVNYAFTAHGSVGHEYAMMGVKVVNAAFNPHIAYNFNYHAKNIEDYKYAIKNLRNLNIHICKDEIYEFYYMRYFYVFSDNIVFYSYKSALKKIATDNVSIVRLFLNEIGTVRHNEIIKHIKGFLTSEKRNYFEYSKSLASEKDENFV